MYLYLPTSWPLKAEQGARKIQTKRAKTKPEARDGERKLDLFPLQETASSDVILAVSPIKWEDFIKPVFFHSFFIKL